MLLAIFAWFRFALGFTKIVVEFECSSVTPEFLYLNCIVVVTYLNGEYEFYVQFARNKEYGITAVCHWHSCGWLGSCIDFLFLAAQETKSDRVEKLLRETEGYLQKLGVKLQ